MSFSTPSARASYPAHFVLLDLFTRHMYILRNAIAEGTQRSYRIYSLKSQEEDGDIIGTFSAKSSSNTTLKFDEYLTMHR